MKKKLRPIVLAAFIMWLLVAATGCSPFQGHFDLRKHGWTTVIVTDTDPKDGKVLLAKYESIVPTPLLVDKALEVKYENPQKQIKFEVTVGTKSKEAASAYSSWVSAFFGFLGGLFVAK